MRCGCAPGLTLAVLSAAACGPALPAAPPSPVPEPAIEVRRPLPDASTERSYLAPPAESGVVDELLASPVIREPDFQAAVADWIEYWTVTARPWFADFVRRMGRYEQRVDSALAAHSMPASLRYLPLIESGYSPRATSHAAAVGMWQLMAGTGRDLGLQVRPLVDERRDPYASTAAALTFLEELHETFGSWFVVLAAYNGGPTRARRILARHAPLAEPSDSLFWALREHFPAETRDFLPKLVAAITVATDAARYDISVSPDPPLAFDVVSVPDATTLDVVARAAGASDEEIADLNPALVRGITPPGEPFSLRVPAGRAEAFAAAYALVPPSERVSFVEHTVADGETLSHIARRYRVSVSDLTAANPDVRPRFLRIGARLTVPIAPSVRASASERRR